MATDAIHRTLSLGSRLLVVSAPATLLPWLPGFAPAGAMLDPDVTIEAGRETGHFHVVDADNGRSQALDAAAALAEARERINFRLLSTLDDAFSLHAACVRRGGDAIVLPGASGSGKTHLALWYRGQGFGVATDEVVAFRREAGQWRASALGRPLILKPDADVTALPLQVGDTPRTLPFGHGQFLCLDGVVPGGDDAVERCLFVFPRFEQGAPLRLDVVRPVDCAMKLMSLSVNVKVMKGGALSSAAALARTFPAIEIRCGATSDLGRALDVITKLALEGMSPGDLQAVCAAMSGSRPVAGSAKAASSSPARRVIPAETLARFPRRLTVGMPTFDDYDGVYFTIQAIRAYHPELAGEIEFLVVDNNPGGACAGDLKALEGQIDGYRYIPRGDWTGTAMKNAVFDEASSELVLCVDCHVLIVPGALRRLADYMEASPGSLDLLQGPLLYDDLNTVSTHFAPGWRGGMYGTWASDPRGHDPDAPPFDIPMQGMGLFACRRAAWPGFNPAFRGFGAEEGYIHEKVRQRGGRTLCLPFLRWVHRFARPMGVPYPNRWEDRMRNYSIGFRELGLDPAAMEAHFAELLGPPVAGRIFAAIKAELGQA